MTSENGWLGLDPSPRYVAAKHTRGQHDTSEEWAQLGRRWGYLAARNARSQRGSVNEVRAEAAPMLASATGPAEGEP